MGDDKKIRELETAIRKMQEENERAFGDYKYKTRKMQAMPIFIIGMVIYILTSGINITIFLIFGSGMISVVTIIAPLMLIAGGIMLFCMKKILPGLILAGVSVLGELIIYKVSRVFTALSTGNPTGTFILILYLFTFAGVFLIAASIYILRKKI